ncbi:hypothetical protein [Pseudodesulfovibrio senegalensis]|jgi:hypothetical protein|uniref:Uncharacterized protein n=1 Tax=Pseudodesulfovibrio senegalensis TaxID=1721087 RepID=A0A6N6N0A1_9BACT|nr:hypothetical protein [Pseudodesulfovibrio senegalensis]KAB1440808.1 hypothetical protein F8A88_12715 [Pseudodesulfovibrio senegalensis]
MNNTFDPELLYVECTKCGQPLLWRAGETTKLLNMAGIDPATLDEHCMLASDGCPSCQPGETRFSTRVVRLAQEARQNNPEVLPADA